MHDNLALNKPATQSSLSPWSTFPTVEEEARGANNGAIDGETGVATGREASPWWQVDLGSLCVVREVRLFHRRDDTSGLRQFSILASLDGARWSVLFRKTDHAALNELGRDPHVVPLPEDSVGRFLRIRLDGTDVLCFRECQVFGQAADAAAIPSLEARFDAGIREQEENRRHRESVLRDGRRGHVVHVEGNAIFVDADRYSPLLVRYLNDDDYETRERALVRDLLRSDDRVLEIGTAIGVVAMTAARIAGPANVVTFEANPEIAADARRNFSHNDLGSIRSHVGVLQNRARFATSPAARDFFISRDFWASRLFAGADDTDIIETIRVPTICLEDEIARHRATVIICDIEGGEVELFTDADLSGIRLLIIEVHHWAVGQEATDAMIRSLVLRGFNVDLYYSGGGMAVLRR